MDIYNLEVVILDLYMLFAPLPCRTAGQGLASSLREHHLNYFYHIFDLFKPFINRDYKLKSRSFIDKRTNKKYSSILFNTLTLPCFNYYRNLFYVPLDTNNADIVGKTKYKKIVPLNINQLITPRGLAY